MRIKYMEQYGVARKEQAAVIKKVQEQLAEQVLVIEGKKDEKNKLLNEELFEKNNLDGLKKKQGTVVKSLEKEEKRLKNDLTESRKAVAKLDKIITSDAGRKALTKVIDARKAYATDLETGLPHQQQLIEHMSHLLALREREPAATRLT